MLAGSSQPVGSWLATGAGTATSDRLAATLTAESTAPFTIGIIQDHATADTAANLARAERLVRDAAGRGAQIICLKELFNGPYFCKAQHPDRFDLAEPIPGPTHRADAARWRRSWRW